jgi:hypothetical protein
MKLTRLLLGGTAVMLASLCAPAPSHAQCAAPELVKGAYKYNDLVCKASAAAKRGDEKAALEFYLSALNQPVLESPNIRLFADIAETYAKLGQFKEADLYLKYDNLSILWMIGIVRCGSNDNALLQDGKLLTSSQAKHMVGVLCGEAFDEYSYFRDRDAKSFTAAAKAILRHDAVEGEIEKLRRGRSSKNR